MPTLAAIRQYLSRGGVIAYPTESCYGLGCDPDNPAAVERILKLKGRPRHKGLILIAAGRRQLQPYVHLPAAEQTAGYWPGPFTFILPARRRAGRWLTGRHNGLAVRVTAHADARRLCRELGMPLVSTSANRSGFKALKTASACRREFGAQIMVLPGRIGNSKNPSTIIHFASGKVLRG